ncbi:YggT family protein [Phenylobacterium sp.]|jgi:YggT family protein|uniref:YggT family protein n=1 Tax=Phenylobacterium sp. TaxID=1871053 RepID=UPI003784A393
MVAIIQFVFFIISSLLSLLVWAIIISAILSWLVAFDVINLRNRFVYSVSRFLDAVTAPVMRPFQRIIPPLGGVDLSPIVVILVITGVQRYLLPALEGFLIRLAAGV